MTRTGAQLLLAIAQQQPVATAKPSPMVANTFGETLRTLNDDVSVIEVSPFPMATTPRSLKIGVLGKVHLCGGLVIDLPGEKPISSE
uniref:Uncharacterized protein n=1 Tax=Romanomermis culicivorax TaxID=13658 RepID=A0A915IBW2_ROMCU